MSESLDLTKPLQDAIAEAEELIANAPFIDTEPLEKKIEHLNRFGESIIAKVNG